MSVHQGSDGDRVLQPELSCLGDETLAATQEKERKQQQLGVPWTSYSHSPLATRSEGTAMGNDTHTQVESLNPGRQSHFHGGSG